MASKSDRFVADIMAEAKKRGLPSRVETWRGKGSHRMLWVGNEVTTVPYRDVDPKTARQIRKALKLDD